MTCDICGPLDRHDGAHCRRCHEAHRAHLEGIVASSRGRPQATASRELTYLDSRTNVRYDSGMSCITISSIRPYIEEGQRYLIDDGTEAKKDYAYYIDVEVSIDSNIEITETHLRIKDLDTVNVRGCYQVAQ